MAAYEVRLPNARTLEKYARVPKNMRRIKRTRYVFPRQA